VAADGLLVPPARHPDLAGVPFRTAAFPLSGVTYSDLQTNGTDVEWSDVPSATLNGFSRSGTRRFDAQVFGDWTGEALSDSKYFDPGAIAHNTYNVGAVVSGPILPDTADFALGAEASLLETPVPRVWTENPQDSALVQVAADSFGVDVTPYLQPHVTKSDVISAFGAFEWRPAERHRLAVRANLGSFTTENPRLGSRHLASLGSEMEGLDASAAIGLNTQIARWLVMEFRSGLASSSREYRPGALTGTSLTDGPAEFGSDATLPGRFGLFDFRGNLAFHLLLGTHAIKIGGAGWIDSHDHTYDFRRNGEYLYGGVPEFEAGQGVFIQSVGVLPAARFTSAQAGAFVQDVWTVVPGMDLTAGFRVDWEWLPKNEVPLNNDWLGRTGIVNNAYEATVFKLSPRLGLTWDVGNRHRWMVRGEVGVYNGTIDPAIMAELITNSVGVWMRRGVGDLGGWPEVPSDAAAPQSGALLSMLGPDFRPPRTIRASFGIAADVGAGATVHFSGAYRHTDYLPRRLDINLLFAPTGHDQFGRPIYGTLVQQGALLTTEPGSNRRFPEFDVVSAFNPDGFSTYWDLTVRLERRVGRFLRLIGSYTYSRTEDNWLSGLGAGTEAQLNPLPFGIAGADWTDGRSDFDIPHRGLVGGEVLIGPLRIAGYYRYESGRPFTPGFRYGVDANGDGSHRNDPAFVDDQQAGMMELISEWDCLRDQVGRFAERNACRGPAVKTVDLRASVTLLQSGPYPVELVVDALNLIESSLADPDRALYLVDRNGSLDVDPSTGVVTVPLAVNPAFGQPVALHTPGRLLRVGLRINYD
jgi:hypothetical protein